MIENTGKDIKPNILVIDDESSMGEFMRIMLGKEGYEVTSEISARKALDELKSAQKNPQTKFDLIITDLMMPELSGLELLSAAQKIDPELDFIVMTAFGSIDTAVEALRKGAYDYITKPFKVDEIKISIKKALEQKNLKRQNAALRDNITSGFDSFIGASKKIIEIKELAGKAASSDITVLITGESGTGKEVLARAIHAESPRSSGPFLSLNCAALPESLLESELFGHMRGSFTGAVKDKTGLLAAAGDGTFFLDEIGETSPAIQAKLLKALEDKEVIPIGATVPVNIDIRLIAATNANLKLMVERGQFRADLYYRLNVFAIEIPPLRGRDDDIELLARYFVKRHCAKADIIEKEISKQAMQALKSFSWPGNIRQLENVLERAIMLTKGTEIGVGDLPEEILQIKGPSPGTQALAVGPDLETMEKAYIYYILNQTGWNKSQSAQILGIDLSTLYRKIDKYGLPKKP